MQAKPGRPPKDSIDRKSRILEAARASFANFGYERTTIREVAVAANVDPKLVMHYFGNKQSLFAAAIVLPPAISNVAELLAAVPRDQWGAMVARFTWAEVDPLRDRTMVGLIRAAASEPRAAEQLRRFYVENVLLRLLQAAKVDAPEVRAVTLSSLIVGLAFSRHIIGVQESFPIDADAQQALVAQTIQTILTAPVRDQPASTSS